MTPTLPDWTRIAWVNRDTRAWYDAIRHRWTSIWSQVERDSVRAGLRRAAFQYCQPDELPKLAEWAARHGLAVAPVAQSAIPSEYAATHTDPQTGQPWQYRVLIAAAAALRPALAAYHAQDHLALGEYLGYPSCCTQRFTETWGRGQIDSTFEAGADGPAETNLWLRWFGVRLVPHLPCRQNCAASLELATGFRQLAVDRGDGWDALRVLEMLDWPMTWSRLHGVAWMMTPALRISTRSDYTLTLDRLSRQGTYQSPAKTLWTDNGFSMPGPMLDAHAAIVAALGGLLTADSRVVDLGAGNGLLLKRIEGQFAANVLGVERDAAVSERRVLGERWLTGNIADVPWDEFNPDVVLLMPGRLLELDPDRADQVRAACLRARHLLLYAYADNLKPDGLAGLAKRAGFTAPLLTLTDVPQHAIGLLATIHE